MDKLINKLRNSIHKDILEKVEKLEKLYDVDKATYILSARTINEFMVNKFFALTKYRKSTVSFTTFEKLLFIEAFYSSQVLHKEILDAMHLVRQLGNNYAHNDTKGFNDDANANFIRQSLALIISFYLDNQNKLAVATAKASKEDYERAENKVLNQQRTTDKDRQKRENERVDDAMKNFPWKEVLGAVGAAILAIIMFILGPLGLPTVSIGSLLGSIIATGSKSSK